MYNSVTLKQYTNIDRYQNISFYGPNRNGIQYEIDSLV